MNLLIDGIKQNLVLPTNITTKLTIDGVTDVYPVYKVNLDLLYYNDKNDRIATWISRYKTENEINEISREHLEEYNEIIHGFIVESNQDKLKATQKNIEMLGQQKHGIVLNDGRIIDGNRRFTCLRNLSRDDPKFNYFEAIIIDRYIEENAKQIKMLELQIQIGEEARVDYDPIDRLVGIYTDIVEDRLLTPHEYAISTNQSDGDVDKDVELATLLVEFLEAINAPKRFYLARELDLAGPLRELQMILKRIKNEDEKNAIKYAVFTNFLLKPEGDLTRFVRQIKKIAGSRYMDEFLEKETDIAENILDRLPEVGKVTEETISDIRKDTEVQEQLKETMEVVINKVKVTDTKERPNQILKKIIHSLEEIDQRIFVKLNEDQTIDLLEQLDLIEEKVKEIRFDLTEK